MFCVLPVFFYVQNLFVKKKKTGLRFVLIISYTVLLISGSFVLILSLRQLSKSKKGITVVGWGSILNFLEFSEIIHFFHIYGIHILVSIFSSHDGAYRILNLNLNLGLLSQKSSYCHQYIFWLLASNLVLLSFWIFLTIWASLFLKNVFLQKKVYLERLF